MKDINPTEITNTTDGEIITRHSPSLRFRAGVELAIVRAVIQAFRDNGLPSITVDDGEEIHESFDNDNQIVVALFAVDESRLVSGQSWVFFVFGNDGWDVICDYSIDLERMMEPIELWIEKQRERYGN